MENVKEFMLLFRIQPSNPQPTEQQIATMHNQWQKFIATIASQGNLINVSRLGFEGNVIKRDQSKENHFFVEGGLFVSGNLTMKAETIEGVIEIAKQCPVLFDGGTVEVRPTIPMS